LFLQNETIEVNYWQIMFIKTDGNSAPGDGFKYRGRGFIQHTGKNQYAAISKATGTDLVSNPDALNSPEVASKAIAWFFLNYKRLKPKDMESISKVNKAVGFADDKAGTQAKKREASAQQIQAEGLKGVRRSGTQVASSIFRCCIWSKTTTKITNSCSC
jgi:predicted chitinase